MSARGGVTSDLSIDEVLLLESIGWEPTELVCGASVVSIPQGVWTWSVGEIGAASSAHYSAVSGAASRIQSECADTGGHGVIGVKAEFTVSTHYVQAVLVGTAVRPRGGGRASGWPFVSDLSTRDFVLLRAAGWDPLGLAFGASFVHVPRRTAGQTLSQKGQNVELTNFTAALYQARESAMERMQSSAIHLQAKGVVAVNVGEGPMSFARHAVAFTAWGTGVRPGPQGHQHIRPRVVLGVDDLTAGFEAAALRGA